MYPNFGRDGNFLTLKVSEKYPGKVVVVDPRGGETPLFTKDGTVNPKLSKTDMETLGPKREVLIAEKDK